MEPTKGILIKTFGNIADADLAAGELRAQGINCVISTDDCAGMYPSMGVIQLLVDAEFAEDARRILKEAPAASSAASGQAEEKIPVHDGTPPTRVLRFNSGLLVGLALGVLVSYGYRHYEDNRNRTDHYDHNRDGIVDEVTILRNGEIVERRFDRDGDGRWDFWTYYKNGLPVTDDIDDNFDGKPDGTLSWSPRIVYTTSKLDTDFNGVPDAFTTFTNGQPMQIDWRPNGTNVVLRRQLFRRGIMAEELRDLNGDGLFDISIKYDAFLNPISTNQLRPASMTP